MIIVIHGDDTFRMRGYLKALLTRYAEKYGTEATIERFATSEHSWEQIAPVITGGGLFSSKKCVVIEEALSNATIRDALQELIEHGVPEDCTLILMIDGAIDKRTKLGKLLLAEKHVHAYMLPEEHEMHGQITKKIEAMSATIEPQAIQLLVSLVGNNTSRMHAEVEKLVHATHGSITQKDVASLVHVHVDDAVWEFVDSLTSKNKKRALQLLEQEFDAGAEPLYLVAMLIRQVRLLLLLGDTQEPDASLAGMLSLHPFVVKKTRAQAHAFSVARLRGLHVALGRLDRALKSGKGEPRVLFTVLIESIVS